MGLLAFLFNLLFPILGPQHPTSYLYGWIACGFIEGLFADGDIVEADNGLSVDILVLTILWGCLKSFRLWRARGAASRIVDCKEAGGITGSEQTGNQCAGLDEDSCQNNCR